MLIRKGTMLLPMLLTMLLPVIAQRVISLNNVSYIYDIYRERHLLRETTSNNRMYGKNGSNTAPSK